ncbi:MAG: exodeoxyribonuclease VII small subunit [Chloroflexi bacterium]|nr:exodeoxyribonuclease VII small subunit [Chloroflexota bacterium]
MAAKRPKQLASPKGTSANLPSDFEETMRELRDVVGQLESQEGGLEVAVTSFERGVKLQQHAQQQLDAARLRVEELLPDGDLADLDLDDEDEG